jgi:hypothetical protein
MPSKLLLLGPALLMDRKALIKLALNLMLRVMNIFTGRTNKLGFE